jgi:uncharacterized membrane protein
LDDRHHGALAAPIEAQMGSSTTVAGYTGASTRSGSAPAAALLGTSLLSAAFASICSAVALFSIDLNDFVTQNRASHEERSFLLLVAVGAAAFAAVPCLVVAWRGGEKAALALERWGLRLSPLSFCYAVPILANYRIWYARPLAFLALLSLVSLLLERTLRVALRQTTGNARDSIYAFGETLPAVVRRFAPSVVVLGGAAAYAAFTARYSIQHHQRLGSLAFDLGIYDNLMFNALHGYFFRSPVLLGPDGGNYIAGHAEFIMVAYVPFYALWPRAEMLLVMQSVLFGFAAFPLYKFARTQVPPWTAVVVALAYLLYAPLHGPNFYDFHWLPTAIFFHFWLYYSIATSRRWLSIACVCVLLLTREDVSVGLAILGTFLVITGLRVRFGIVLAAVSVVYFAIVKFAIMPWAGVWSFTNMYKDLIPKGESGYIGIMRTVATNPSFFLGTLLTQEKLVYVLHLFAPVVFLPWRRATLAFLASAGFFFTLMTTGYQPTLSIAFQYTSHWIPYIFAATVLSLRLLGREVVRRQAATGALAFAMSSHSLVFGALFQQETFVGGFGHVPFRMTESERLRYEDMKALVSKIPRDASVAATESEVPHVSNRLTAYALRDFHGGADYLLVNRNLRDHVNTHRTLLDAFANYQYGLLEQRPPLYLFKRGHTSPGTDSAKRDLGLR